MFDPSNWDKPKTQESSEESATQESSEESTTQVSSKESNYLSDTFYKGIPEERLGWVPSLINTGLRDYHKYLWVNVCNEEWKKEEGIRETDRKGKDVIVKKGVGKTKLTLKCAKILHGEYDPKPEYVQEVELSTLIRLNRSGVGLTFPRKNGQLFKPYFLELSRGHVSQC